MSKVVVLHLKTVGKCMLYVNGVMLEGLWNVKGMLPRVGSLKGSPNVQVGSKDEPTQRYYHIQPWVVDESERNSEKDTCLHVVLFVPKGTLPLRMALVKDVDEAINLNSSHN